MWRNGFQIQFLLHKYRVEHTEVISMLLFTFITRKLQEHLVGTFTVSNTLSYLCHNYNVTNLKSESHLPKNYFTCFNESPINIMKNAFYFILKTLLVLKIFKFLC